jgi:hypothetical protein
MGMTIRRTTSGALAAGALLTLAAASPAAALPPLQFDQPCYAETGPIVFQGAGFTPFSPVDLLWGAGGRIERSEHLAVAEGRLLGSVRAPAADRFMQPGEKTVKLTFTANDRARMNDGGPPDPASEAAVGTVTLSRYGVWPLIPQDARRLRPGMQMMIDAHGFAHARGEMLYAHWTRRGRRLATQRLGRAAGDCGNRRRVVRAYPFARRPAGDYVLYVSTHATRARAENWVATGLRLARRDARP